MSRCSHASSAIDAGVSSRGFSQDAFRGNLEDPTVPLSADMAVDSRTLLLAFGGMVGRIGIPPFEFFSLTADLPVKRLFVRDLRQAWYHRGVPDHGSTLTGLADSLRGLLRRHEVQRLVVAGNSAGGYAALLFGTLLGANAVLCFAPQTVLDLDVLAGMDDHRWDDRLREHTAAGVMDARFTDLRPVIGAARRGDTRYGIYFDDSLRADRLHAERLACLPGVQLYRFGHGAHNVARALREAGALERVLQGALEKR